MTGAGRFLVCFAAPDTDGSAGGGHIPVSHLEASSARILTGGQAIDLDTGEHTVTTVAGQVGSDVATVDIVRTRGSEVNATVAHGWFFAWWPTDSRAKRLHLSLRDGSHLDLPVD
jgi:hypothetical protein